jgi:hypothetical protein
MLDREGGTCGPRLAAVIIMLASYPVSIGPRLDRIDRFNRLNSLLNVETSPS